jgi:hypothetical protein
MENVRVSHKRTKKGFLPIEEVVKAQNRLLPIGKKLGLEGVKQIPKPPKPDWPQHYDSTMLSASDDKTPLSKIVKELRSRHKAPASAPILVEYEPEVYDDPGGIKLTIKWPYTRAEKIAADNAQKEYEAKRKEEHTQYEDMRKKEALDLLLRSGYKVVRK